MENTEINANGIRTADTVIRDEGRRREQLRTVFLDMLKNICCVCAARQVSNSFVVELFTARYDETWDDAANIKFARDCATVGLSVEALANGDMLVRQARNSATSINRRA